MYKDHIDRFNIYDTKKTKEFTLFTMRSEAAVTFRKILY